VGVSAISAPLAKIQTSHENADSPPDKHQSTCRLGLGSLGGLDVWSVRSVKSLGLKFPAYSHRVTANRHVACTYIAETTDPKDPGCR
jgi:hypothetical protein